MESQLRGKESFFFLVFSQKGSTSNRQDSAAQRTVLPK